MHKGTPTTSQICRAYWAEIVREAWRKAKEAVFGTLRVWIILFVLSAVFLVWGAYVVLGETRGEWVSILSGLAAVVCAMALIFLGFMIAVPPLRDDQQRRELRELQEKMKPRLSLFTDHPASRMEEGRGVTYRIGVKNSSTTTPAEGVEVRLIDMDPMPLALEGALPLILIAKGQERPEAHGLPVSVHAADEELFDLVIHATATAHDPEELHVCHSSSIQRKVPPQDYRVKLRARSKNAGSDERWVRITATESGALKVEFDD